MPDDVTRVRFQQSRNGLYWLTPDDPVTGSYVPAAAYDALKAENERLRQLMLVAAGALDRGMPLEAIGRVKGLLLDAVGEGER